MPTVTAWTALRPSSLPLQITSAWQLWKKAIHLRKLGITTPILVMGGTLREQLPDFFEYDLTLAASSLDLLTAAEQLAVVHP